jgi:hypothetical protein
MENGWLVVTGTMEFYDFPYFGNVIIPTYELRFFRGVGIPPTRLYIPPVLYGSPLKYMGIDGN